MTGAEAGAHPDPSHELPWRIVLPVAFAVGNVLGILAAVLDPRSIGSHAVIYTDAAATWLAGGDPWSAGPPIAKFAGPPSMLVPFVPFTAVPQDLIRVAWVAGMAIVAILVVRRLRLPGWWIGFPPIFQAITLGHPEVLVLGLLCLPGAFSGLAATIKPYAALPLLAERRWAALGLALVAVLVSLPFLPWARMVELLPEVTARFIAFGHGDSTWGEPVLMVVAIVALAALGLRRALWLATPVLWPYAQPIYQSITVPALSPLLAAIWALQVPGLTLWGLVLVAAIEVAGRRLRIGLPAWLWAGIEPASPTFRDSARGGSPREQPPGAATQREAVPAEVVR